MKKLLSLAALSAVSALVAGIFTSDAHADPRIAPSVASLLATRITGTFTVPAVQTGALANFACSNIHITATSKETIPPPPGGLFSTPKWTRSVAATGTYSSGKCSYSLSVPSGSEFYLSTGSGGSFACNYVGVWLGPTGAAIGPYSVALGMTRTQNFEVTRVTCEFIN